MIHLNFKRMRRREHKYAGAGMVTVNGVVVKLAWLIRTGKRGVVKTYDVIGDGHPHSSHEKLNWPKGVDRNVNKVASITLRGHVKIKMAGDHK